MQKNCLSRLSEGQDGQGLASNSVTQLRSPGLKDQPFILGVNYWPRRKAMYWWKHFEAREVSEEFEQIKKLRLKLVRIFLLWEDFQPTPSEVNHRSIKNLQTVLEIARVFELKILVTFFTGHMSGVNWIPDWALSSRPLKPNAYRSISDGRVCPFQIGYFYRDPHLIRSQVRLLRTVIPKIHKYPSLYGWDLGNEPSILLKPKTVYDLMKWTKTLRREILKMDPIHPITLGIHQGDLIEDTKFHPSRLRFHLDIPSMHGYPNYSTWTRNPTDSKALAFLNYLTEIMSRKKVLFAEFGLPIPPKDKLLTLQKKSNQFFASEDQAASYFQKSLTSLQRIGSLGALLWCYSDYHPDLAQQPPFDNAPHELYFGLTRWNGILKKHAEVIKKWGRKTHPVLPTPPFKNFSTKDFFRSPSKNLQKLYQSFLKQF